MGNVSRVLPAIHPSKVRHRNGVRCALPPIRTSWCQTTCEVPCLHRIPCGRGLQATTTLGSQSSPIGRVRISRLCVLARPWCVVVSAHTWRETVRRSRWSKLSRMYISGEAGRRGAGNDDDRPAGGGRRADGGGQSGVRGRSPLPNSPNQAHPSWASLSHDLRAAAESLVLLQCVRVCMYSEASRTFNSRGSWCSVLAFSSHTATATATRGWWLSLGLVAHVQLRRCEQAGLLQRVE